MLAKSLFIFASLALASAKPVARRQGSSCAAKTKPTLPKYGGDDELDGVPEGHVLKYIALGHGIQNYTCTAGEEASATGALAVLYDATSHYPAQGRGSLPSVEHFNSLTTTALRSTALPLNSDGETQYGAALDGPFPEAADLEMPGTETLPFLGQHIFDGSGVPTFYTGESESEAELLFKAKLAKKHPAPAGADKGVDDTGAVAWLQLEDQGASKGLSYIYRVVTAGGAPKACTDDTPQSVPYTTYYWMFGPEN